MQLSLGITRDLSCYSTSKGYGCLDYVVLLRTLEHTHGIKATQSTCVSHMLIVEFMFM